MLNPDLNYTNLTKSEFKQYARHLILPSIAMDGQKRLGKARVLCVGIGGLGSACLLYLAAAGIGTIGIIDNDLVEKSNLQRQIIYQMTDIGQKKVECAQRNIQKINSKCKIESYYDILNIHNVMQIVPKYDVIVDGTDNLESRHIISNACYTFNKPHIYGALSEFEGQISVFNYQGGPNYQDFFSQTITTQTTKACSINGVLGMLPGIIGSLQAIEVIKIVVGINNILSGSILIFNALSTSFKKVRLRKIISNMYRPAQPTDSLNKYSILSSSSPISTTTNISNNKTTYDITVKDQILLIDVRKPCEYQLHHIKDSINIPLRKFKHKNTISFLTNQSHKKHIYIYCNKESRSTAALLLLTKHGIVNHKYKILTNLDNYPPLKN